MPFEHDEALFRAPLPEVISGVDSRNSGSGDQDIEMLGLHLAGHLAGHLARHLAGSDLAHAHEPLLPSRGRGRHDRG
jgi:hypothetical protein